MVSRSHSETDADKGVEVMPGKVPARYRWCYAAAITPLLPMTFLTVKEAAAKTGKSPSSIRRLIYPILENDEHADRPHIEPNPAEARVLRLKGENFAWRVSEEFLAREVTTKAAHDPAKPKREGGGDEPSMHELIVLLREQL